MQVFQQNGKEVFVLSSAINVFGVRPDAIPLLLADLQAASEELQKVAQTSLVMRKIGLAGDTMLPGDELLWINDPEIDADQRLMVVMRAEPNEAGGHSYSAINIAELREKTNNADAEGLDPLAAMLGGLGGAMGQEGQDPLIGLLSALAAASEDGEGCGEADCPACQTEEALSEETRVQ